MGADVQSVAGEIANALAEKTGVDPRSVHRILEALSLEGALAHRQACVANAKRFGFAVDEGLAGIRPENARIAIAPAA